MKAFSTFKASRFYLLLGTLWLVIQSIGYFGRSEIFGLISLNEVWKAIFLVPVNYLFFEYCLPVILKKRPRLFLNILLGCLLAAFHLALVSLVLYAWTRLGITLELYTQLRYSVLLPGGAFDTLLDAVFYEAESGVASVFFFGVAKLFHHNFVLRETAQQMRLEKQEAELNFLKSQTNPHFLFNTLNNIYSLARDKSDLAPEAVLRLSKILRFMLYETNREFIALEQELEIIRDYISLEELRYDDSLSINLDQDIDDPQQTLPPLLLIPLVENAFKHGASESSEKAFIDIRLSVCSQQLEFEVRNSTMNPEAEGDIQENIGLSNLRRQLELQYSEYNLYIHHEEAVFTAFLKIDLAKHV